MGTSTLGQALLQCLEDTGFHHPGFAIHVLPFASDGYSGQKGEELPGLFSLASHKAFLLILHRKFPVVTLGLGCGK